MRVAPSLDTLGSLVICEGPYVQTDPAVEYNGADYIVVWSDMRFTGSHYWIVCSRVDTSGAVMDTGFCIGAQEPRDECRPDLAYDGERCFVVWFSNDAPYGVYGRFVNAQGQPEGSTVLVSSALASYNVNPGIAFAGGNYFVVWADQRPGFSDLDITGQFVSPEGALIGPPLVIATGPENQVNPEVAYDGSVVLVVWRESETAIYAQKIYPNGGLCGGAFRISDSAPDYRFNPGLHMSSANYLVVWSETRAGELDIYGNAEVLTPVEERAVPLPQWKGATVLSGRLQLPRAREHRLYDVCGRDVTGRMIAPGIYFVEVVDRFIQKIVLTR